MPSLVQTSAPTRHILCTGGTGYIGSHTVVKLIESGFRVSVLDNLSNSSIGVLDRLEEITGQRIVFYEIDMCDSAAVDRLFSAERFDGVIHFAGLKAVGESMARPFKYYDNNISGTLCIIKAMRKYGCNAMVFSSSATVYRPCEEVLDESRPLGCSNPYGWTKYVIEQLLQDACKADGRLAVSVLRYFNPCGAHPSGRMGESPDGTPNNLMPFLQQVAVGRRAHLDVFGADFDTPDGTGVRDYVHVDDIAEGHICALRSLFGGARGVTVHNLGSGRGYSVLEMLRAFEEAAGRPLPYKIAARRPGDLASVVANAEKARVELGWTARRSLSDIMASAWKWQSSNPHGYGEAREPARMPAKL